MSTYYVATLGRYVLVDAANQQQARDLGQAALNDLYAKDGRHVPVVIRTVRPAAPEEIELARSHAESLANERGRRMHPCEAKVADAIRHVAAAITSAIDSGQRSTAIDAEDLTQALLAVADRLDPPYAN